MPVESQRNPYSIFDPRRYLSPDQGVNFRVNDPITQSDPAALQEEAAAPAVSLATPSESSLPTQQFGIASTGGDSFDRLRNRLTGSMGGGTTAATPAAPPSWDSLRAALGQGNRPAVPQIFNQGVEQHPLASVADIPRRESQAWDLYNASTLGSPAEVVARRNEIIGRHNLNRQLENEYYNMGRGMYSPERARQVSLTGLDPTLGLGTEGRLAGAHEMTAGSHQLQAMTDAAKTEYFMSPAQARQRFMEKFPHATPDQLATLVAGEEGRGGFAGRTLRFPIGGGARVSPGGSALGAVPLPAGATTPTQSSFLSDAAPAAPPVPPPIWDALAQRINANPNLRRPEAAPGHAATADVSPGEFIARLDRTIPGLFAANTPEGLRMREALIPYLNQRFDPTDVAQAQRGVNQFAGLTTTPRAANIATWGGLSTPGAGAGAARLAPLLGAGRLGTLAARGNPIGAALSALTSLPVLWDYGRSIGRGGAMTDDQAGRAILAQATAGNWGG